MHALRMGHLPRCWVALPTRIILLVPPIINMREMASDGRRKHYRHRRRRCSVDTLLCARQLSTPSLAVRAGSLNGILA